MVDLTVVLSKNTTVEEVRNAFKVASKGSHKGILGVDEEDRVSQDFVGESLSTVVAQDTIQVIGGNMVKVLSWYDNEWGYSCRLVDMAVHISKDA
jgi:glyceraldehyde 3-phosphate dehydrogenase